PCRRRSTLIRGELVRKPHETDGEHELDGPWQLRQPKRVDACTDDRPDVVVNLNETAGDDPVDVQRRAATLAARYLLGWPLVTSCSPCEAASSASFLSPAGPAPTVVALLATWSKRSTAACICTKSYPRGPRLQPPGRGRTLFLS